MVVDGNRDHLLGLFLTDDIIIQFGLDFMRGRDAVQIKFLLRLRACFLFLHPLRIRNPAASEQFSQIKDGKGRQVRRLVIPVFLRLLFLLRLFLYLFLRPVCCLFFFLLICSFIDLFFRLFF